MEEKVELTCKTGRGVPKRAVVPPTEDLSLPCGEQGLCGRQALAGLGATRGGKPTLGPKSYLRAAGLCLQHSELYLGRGISFTVTGANVLKPALEV
jgi:hypothetical protein